MDTTPRRSVTVVTALTTLCASAAFAVGFTGTQADAEPAATLTAQDTAFLTTAAQNNLAEIELGRLAEKQGGRPAVRRSGQEMVSEHREQLRALRTVAASVGFTLPDRPNREQRRIAKAWSRAEGSSFDCAYIPFQYDDHRGTILLHQLEVAAGGDPQVKAAAQAALPVLTEHLGHAAGLVSKLRSCD